MVYRWFNDHAIQRSDPGELAAHRGNPVLLGTGRLGRWVGVSAAQSGVHDKRTTPWLGRSVNVYLTLTTRGVNAYVNINGRAIAKDHMWLRHDGLLVDGQAYNPVPLFESPLMHPDCASGARVRSLLRLRDRVYVRTVREKFSSADVEDFYGPLDPRFVRLNRTEDEVQQELIAQIEDSDDEDRNVPVAPVSNEREEVEVELLDIVNVTDGAQGNSSTNGSVAESSRADLQMLYDDPESREIHTAILQSDLDDATNSLTTAQANFQQLAVHDTSRNAIVCKHRMQQAQERVHAANIKLDEWNAFVSKNKQDEEDAKERKGRMGVCCICYDNAVTHLVIPCGHSCLCETCKDSLQRPYKCPMCREVANVSVPFQKVFLSASTN